MKKVFLLIVFLLTVGYSFLFSEPPNWEPISGTLYSMVVFADIYLDYNIFTGSDTSNVAAAFGPGGENDCRSLGTWQPDYPPYWDGYWYFTIVSNINNEPITFKIYDAMTDSVYSCLQTISFEDGATVGSPYEPYELTTQPVSTDHNNNQTSLFVYPNPFSDRLTFSLPSMHKNDFILRVFDIKGRMIKCFSTKDIDSKNTVKWLCIDEDGFRITPGVYLYTFSSPHFKSSGKIVHIRE